MPSTPREQRLPDRMWVGPGRPTRPVPGADPEGRAAGGRRPGVLRRRRAPTPQRRPVEPPPGVFSVRGDVPAAAPGLDLGAGHRAREAAVTGSAVAGRPNAREPLLDATFAEA